MDLKYSKRRQIILVEKRKGAIAAAAMICVSQEKPE